MAKIHKGKVRPKGKSKHLADIAQKHITRRIGSHQRAALRSFEPPDDMPFHSNFLSCPEMKAGLSARNDCRWLIHCALLAALLSFRNGVAELSGIRIKVLSKITAAGSPYARSVQSGVQDLYR